MPRIIYFSLVRERLGKSEEDLDFRGRVSELREVLKGRYPEIRDILDKIRFAVNEEYVGEDHEVEEGDTVALIPPVSGG